MSIIDVSFVFSIHEYTTSPPAGDTETESSSGALDSASDSEHSASSDELQQNASMALCAYKGMEDDQERSNYYPISWRVVSGGVKMSGSRKYTFARFDVNC